MRVLDEETMDRVAEYNIRYQREHGRSPSFRNVMHALGLGSLATVQRYVRALERRGSLELEKDGSIQPIPSLLSGEQRSTENSINNIMTAIENGGTSNTAMKRLRELEEKNAELEKKIRIEQSHSAFKLDRKEITDFYKFALEQEPKMLINLLVKEIRLFDDKMIIVYNAPRTISLDESQGFSFYTDNVPYPIYIQNVKQPRMTDFQLIMRL